MKRELMSRRYTTRTDGQMVVEQRQALADYFWLEAGM